MVDERHGTVPGLVGGTARRRFIGGGRVPRRSTAYLLLSLFGGLTLFPAVFFKANYGSALLALAAVRY